MMKSFFMATKEIFLGIFFVTILSLAAHLLFSSIGFVPTDDGFLLAYSRRILDGQIPYKDFLSAHNIGTPLLFVPFVYWGGEYTYWITRFVVWFEFAAIAWIWTVLILKYLSVNINIFFRFGLAIIAFFFTAHSFPPMAWYTIDGLLFYSLGLLFCSKENTNLKTVGYFLIGFTFIIKQNFIFLLPSTIFLLGDWKNIRFWIAIIFPSLAFYSFFLIHGSIRDAIAQTTSRTEFMETAIKGFTSKFTFPWGIITGFTGIYLLQKNNFKKASMGFILCLLPILYSVYFLHNAGKFIFDASFFLFGAVFGIAVFFLRKEKLIGHARSRFLLIGLMIAWTVAISGGYNTPAFASGILFLYIATIIIHFTKTNKSVKNFNSNIVVYFLLIILPITIYNFYYTRTHAIYGEPGPSTEMTYKADTVLPGGKYILLSKEVYLQLADLQNAIKVAQNVNMPYALLPSYAGLWVQGKQENPLPMDYPFLFNDQKALIDPFIAQMLKKKGKFVIIVSKSSLNQVQDLSKHAVYQIALFVPQHFTKFNETKYYALYR